jgi:GGDEF domain-containing protein
VYEFVDSIARRLPTFEELQPLYAPGEDSFVSQRILELATDLNASPSFSHVQFADINRLIGQTLTAIASTECTDPDQFNAYRKYLAAQQRDLVFDIAVHVRSKSAKSGKSLLPEEVWDDGDFQHQLRKRRKSGSLIERVRKVRILSKEIGVRIGATDVLTDLPLRRLYEDKFYEAVQHTMESREYLSLILFDVDDFKTFNTAYGYAGGDDILKAVGHHLKKVCRTEERRKEPRGGTDRRRNSAEKDVFHLPYRVGGEEFKVLIFPGVDEDVLETIMEDRICRGLEEMSVPLSAGYKHHSEGEILRTTVSVAGLTMIPREHFDRSHGGDWDEMSTSEKAAFAEGLMKEMNNKVNTGLDEVKHTGKNHSKLVPW